MAQGVLASMLIPVVFAAGICYLLYRGRAVVLLIEFQARPHGSTARVAGPTSTREARTRGPARGDSSSSSDPT